MAEPPMHFKKISSLFPQQSLWIAASSLIGFVITEEDGRYSSSARPLGDAPSKVIYLGEFKEHPNFESAVAVCEKFLKTFEDSRD